MLTHLLVIPPPLQSLRTQILILHYYFTTNGLTQAMNQIGDGACRNIDQNN